jgi:hypothetical protein
MYMNEYFYCRCVLVFIWGWGEGAWGCARVCVGVLGCVGVRVCVCFTHPW